jgi:hypothetical protein
MVGRSVSAAAVSASPKGKRRRETEGVVLLDLPGPMRNATKTEARPTTPTSAQRMVGPCSMRQMAVKVVSRTGFAIPKRVIMKTSNAGVPLTTKPLVRI